MGLLEREGKKREREIEVGGSLTRHRGVYQSKALRTW